MRERYANTGNRGVDAVLCGIRELDERQRLELESRRAQMHELVSSIAYECNGDPEALLRALQETRPLYKSALSVYERIAVCRELISLCPALEIGRSLPFNSLEALPEEAINKIAFVENNYTSEAFSRISRQLELATPVFTRSFDELCERVYNGEVEFGILPVESTDNGKLLYFYSLINKYELKIAAVCSVDTSDLGSTTFALIRKSIEYPRLRFGKPDMLELFVTQTENDSFSDILTASELCSMKLYRVDSLPLSYRSESFITCPVFRATDAEIDVFLLYMALDFPQYTPIGIYSYLE